MKIAQKNKILETCLIAGRIMIESGSEMYRVEDTMNRIAYNAGIQKSVVFTTPTGLFIGIENQPYVQLESVAVRTINLEKVENVNTASRQFATKEITLDQLSTRLKQIDQHTPYFPLWIQIIAAAFVSALLMIIFSGEYDWADLLPAALVGALGYAVFSEINRLTSIRFIGEFLGAVSIGVSAYLLTKWHLGVDLDNIIIGAVMPLVPGVAITNSIRDMLAGHLLSGIVRGVEALLSAFAIGTGIALIFRFLI
ncbi:threonine/serine exporter family protein [Latilactobacillus sakei]